MHVVGRAGGGGGARAGRTRPPRHDSPRGQPRGHLAGRRRHESRRGRRGARRSDRRPARRCATTSSGGDTLAAGVRLRRRAGSGCSIASSRTKRVTHRHMATAQRTYLEMRDPRWLRPARVDDATIRILRAEQCYPALYRFLYGEVGAALQLDRRLSWTDDEIRAHLAQPAVSIWLLLVRGTPAGYFELKARRRGRHRDRLLRSVHEFIGRGLGAHLLTEAVETGLELRAATGCGCTRARSIIRPPSPTTPAAASPPTGPKSILSDVDQPLWTPSADRIARANLTRFIAQVARRHRSVGDGLRVALPVLDRAPARVLAGGLDIHAASSATAASGWRSISIACPARASFPTRR